MESSTIRDCTWRFMGAMYPVLYCQTNSLMTVTGYCYEMGKRSRYAHLYNLAHIFKYSSAAADVQVEMPLTMSPTAEQKLTWKILHLVGSTATAAMLASTSMIDP